MNNYELYHHGVLGQKWGIRRYQNSDGTLTSAGKTHYKTSKNTNKQSTNTRNSSGTAKKVVASAIVVGTIAAASVYCAKHPESVSAAKNAISTIGNNTISSMKSAGAKTVSNGKQFIVDAAKNTVKGVSDGAKEAVLSSSNGAKTVAKGVKEGIQEGLYEGSKKATKAVITGTSLVAAKKMLDATVGKEEAARIFQANDKKKISKFWKVSGEDEEQED